MQIRIAFENKNTRADGINVYRSATPMIPGQLPAKLATIAGNATEYLDSAVTYGNSYYYIFEVYKGTEKILTSNIRGWAMNYSGPGSQSFVAGDINIGYYGLVPAQDFTTYDKIIDTFLPSGFSNRTTESDQKWMKFSHKGKTLFVPQRPFGTVSWNSLYLAGLVYGVDGVGPRDYNTQTATNQLRTITIGGSLFKVRLMTFLPPGFDLTTNFTGTNTPSKAVTGLGAGNYTSDSYDTTLDLTGSEWNDLMYKMFTNTPPSQRGSNFDKLDVGLAWNPANNSILGISGDNHSQERLPGTSILGRGYAYANTVSLHPGNVSVNSSASAYYWRPVLELIS